MDTNTKDEVLMPLLTLRRFFIKKDGVVQLFVKFVSCVSDVPLKFDEKNS